MLDPELALEVLCEAPRQLVEGATLPAHGEPRLSDVEYYLVTPAHMERLMQAAGFQGIANALLDEARAWCAAHT